MAHNVFVSYANQDRGCAMELVAHLEARGVKVWVAPRDIAPAREWAEAIIDAIENARIMVLIFSSACNESPHVRREVERAVHRRLALVPFRIESVLPVKSLEYYISAQHWLDALTQPRDAHYERLWQAVSAVLQPVTAKGADAKVDIDTYPLSIAMPPPPLRFGDTQLRKLQLLLAQHIGPVASHLVRRAAKTAPDYEALTRTLAAEIDAPAAQRDFVAACGER